MALYRWRGINAEGAPCKGSLESTDQQSLNHALLSQGVAVLSAREASPVLHYFQIFWHQKPSAYECHLFFAHVSSFLQAGIPLKQALQILQGVQRSALLRRDLRAMIVALDQGRSFCAIIKGYAYLPAYAYPLIQTSEQTGSLIAALDTISAMTLADYEYQKVIRNACIGPMITICVAGLVLCVTMTVLMPQFHQLYKQCNVNPPVIILIGSKLATFFTPSVLTVTACLLGGLLIVLRASNQFFSSASVAARVPFLRNTLLNADMLRWLTIMHAYASNGLPLGEACSAMQQSTHNPTTKNLIAASVSALQAGKQLSDGLALLSDNRTIAFIRPLLSIGEETGNLTPMLARAKNELETIMQQQTNLFTKLVGPILTIVTGLLIGGLLVMLYVPIMQLGSLIKF